MTRVCVCVCLCTIYLDILEGDGLLTVDFHLLLNGLKNTTVSLKH